MWQIDGVSDSAALVYFGNLLLFISLVMYLAFWIVGYKPADPEALGDAGSPDRVQIPSGKGRGTGRVKKILLFVGALVLGVLAVVFVALGAVDSHVNRYFFPIISILLGGVAVFLLFYWISGSLLHRPLTSELPIMVGWAIAEMISLNVLYAEKIMAKSWCMQFVIILSVVVVVALVCYLIYYKVREKVAYVLGVIPLAMGVLYMVYFDVIVGAHMLI